MDWLTLILPIAHEFRNMIELFTRDNGRVPTPEEFEALARARSKADADWAAALERLRNRG